MVLPDVNVLVHAHRTDDPAHLRHRDWMADMLATPTAFAVADVILTGFVRVVTNPRVFARPTPLGLALDFVTRLRAAPNAVLLSPGARYWPIFTDLCRSVDARGNLVPDAVIAALAIEHGAQVASNDRDFARFPGLRWSAPAGDG